MEKNKFKEEELFTPEYLSSKFSVHITTISNWTKRGILKRHAIGGRVYYKRSQVEAALIELKPNNSKTSNTNKKN